MFKISVIFTLTVQRFFLIKNVGKIKKTLKTRFHSKNLKKNVYKRLLQLCSLLSRTIYSFNIGMAKLTLFYFVIKCINIGPKQLMRHAD